jgi:hypothetical protein
VLGLKPAVVSLSTFIAAPNHKHHASFDDFKSGVEGLDFKSHGHFGRLIAVMASFYSFGTLLS